MKHLRTYLFWPIIFLGCWYFFGFTVAVILGFIYLHVMCVIMSSLVEKYTEKLAQIIEYVDLKENSNKEILKDIFTGEDIEPEDLM